MLFISTVGGFNIVVCVTITPHLTFTNSFPYINWSLLRMVCTTQETANFLKITPVSKHEYEETFKLQLGLWVMLPVKQ